MSSVTTCAPRIPSTEAGPGGRLYAAFLTGRSLHILRAHWAARDADPQTTMRFDDDRQDLAGRMAANLASVL